MRLKHFFNKKTFKLNQNQKAKIFIALFFSAFLVGRLVLAEENAGHEAHNYALTFFWIFSLFNNSRRFFAPKTIAIGRDLAKICDAKVICYEELPNVINEFEKINKEVDSCGAGGSIDANTHRKEK